VVEAGIGTAAVALPLQRLTGRPVIGIDLSPAMLAQAVARIGRRVAVGDAEQLPLRVSSVDTVLLVWVLQLVPDIGRVLREVRRMLRPGGRLLAVLSRPHERPGDIEYLQRLLFERLGPRAPDGPHHVADLAREQGLSVLATTHTTEQEWDQTPVEAAERLERRTFASLLQLDEARFEEVVMPIARAMRELPEPERPRRRGGYHDFLVCERPA
jgi:SAM-dependent methyltransferase